MRDIPQKLNCIKMAPNLILTTACELKSLIENAVEVAVRQQVSLPQKIEPNPVSEIMDIDACIKLTGLKKPSIYAQTSSRTIPHYRKGKRLYFIRSEILAWITEGKRPMKTI